MEDTYRVLLIDDNGDLFAKEIEKRLDCYAQSMDIDRALKSLDKEYFVNRYECFLIDATYVSESGNSAIDFSEKFIQMYPAMRDKIKILLGSDVQYYLQNNASDGDMEAQVFLSRVRELPRILYNNKITSVISEIKLIASSKNIKIEEKLEEGPVSEELVTAAKKEIERLSKLKKLVLDNDISGNLDNTKIKVEDDRQLSKILKELAIKYFKMQHDLTHYAVLLDMYVKKIERKNESINKKR